MTLTCARKKAYRSLREAGYVAGKCIEKRGKPLRAYFCPECAHYHLTSREVQSARDLAADTAPPKPVYVAVEEPAPILPEEPPLHPEAQALLRALPCIPGAFKGARINTVTRRGYAEWSGPVKLTGRVLVLTEKGREWRKENP